VSTFPLTIGRPSETVTERDQEDHAVEPQPDPSTSPFARPGVMSGYPLSRDEQEHVDRLAKRDEDEEQR
jgi:hypothetical protein